MSDSKLNVMGEPRSWLAIADEFYRAADEVWDQFLPVVRYEIEDTKNETTDIKTATSLSRSYILLMSHAIEYLIKGHIIFQKPSLLTDGDYKFIETREVSTLIKEVKGIELNEDELAIIKDMEQVIPYWGRFPISIAYSKAFPDIGVDISAKILIEGIYFKYAGELYKKINEAWEKSGGVWKIVSAKRYDDYLERKAELERFKRWKF